MRVKLSTLSEAERVARIRTQSRDRKRAERDRLRQAGRPDATAVERAVVDAVRQCLLAAPAGERLRRPIHPQSILKVAALLLKRRALDAYEAGAEPIHYTTEGVSGALEARLLTPPQRPTPGAP